MPTIIETFGTPLYILIFNLVLVLLVVISLSYNIAALVGATKTPTQPDGAIGLVYDSQVPKRSSLANYMTANSIPDTTPLLQFQVATANFGGIFTESMTPNPYIGTVSTDAVRMQIGAGARAVVFDIWPDPAEMSKPVVCAMLDMNKWWYQRWWLNVGGMNNGVCNNYSNWQMLTRNKVSAAAMFSAAIGAAFGTTNSNQNQDPFFLILKLHGAMTIDYLNKLGTQLQTALGGHALAPTYGKWQQQSSLCTMPISAMLPPKTGGSGSGGLAYVIVIPDISKDTTTDFRILPNVISRADFLNALKGTILGELTNAVEQDTPIMYSPEGPPSTSADQVTCVTGESSLITLARKGFCLVQPSIGGPQVDNVSLYASAKSGGFSGSQATGAQFVAMNLFSPDPSDGVLQAMIGNPNTNFGKYSFIKNT